MYVHTTILAYMLEEIKQLLHVFDNGLNLPYYVYVNRAENITDHSPQRMLITVKREGNFIRMGRWPSHLLFPN